MVFSLTFYDTGDAGDFQSKIKEQLAQDLAEAQEEYNAAILAEADAKKDKRRRIHLQTHPKDVKSKSDKNLMKHDEKHWENEWQNKRTARKAAKKEIDEAYKAFDTHKEEESKGFVRENDITKVGSQYKASWTHLPA